jgi:fermentation-respiration switch protein FrsA (DUF1100 family)
MKINIFSNFYIGLLVLFTTLPECAFSQSADFTIRDIKFESQGITLAGSVIEPKNPWAAVVIVHGSDPVKRETEFARRLAEKGIAVLTYDKRGVGESGGVYVGPSVGTNNIDTANLNLLAQDADAAVKIFRTYKKYPSDS